MAVKKADRQDWYNSPCILLWLSHPNTKITPPFPPDCGGHTSFNAKMDLANFECNLKTRDSQKWPRKGDLSLWEHRGSGPETK